MVSEKRDMGADVAKVNTRGNMDICDLGVHGLNRYLLLVIIYIHVLYCTENTTHADSSVVQFLDSIKNAVPNIYHIICIYMRSTIKISVTRTQLFVITTLTDAS